MKVQDENYKNVNLEDMLFKVSKENVGQKYYMTLICKKEKDYFSVVTISLYILLIIRLMIYVSFLFSFGNIYLMRSCCS